VIEPPAWSLARGDPLVEEQILQIRPVLDQAEQLGPDLAFSRFLEAIGAEPMDGPLIEMDRKRSRPAFGSRRLRMRRSPLSVFARPTCRSSSFRVGRRPRHNDFAIAGWPTTGSARCWLRSQARSGRSFHTPAITRISKIPGSICGCEPFLRASSRNSARRSQPRRLPRR
jgi:hypothetical protein